MQIIWQKLKTVKQVAVPMKVKIGEEELIRLAEQSNRVFKQLFSY